MTEPTVLPSEVHPTIALLPWYLSGTLSAEEHTAVSTHLQGCQSCRQEMEDLAQLRTRIQQADDAGPLPSAGLAQAVLARVRNEPLRHTDRRTALPPVHAAPGGLLAEADRWLRTLLTPQWVPTLIAFLLIGQVGLLTWNLVQPKLAPETGASPADLVTSRGLGASTMRLEIEFEPAATMDQLQRLLESVQARMVIGPTPRRTFIIELPMSDAASAQGRTELLRSRRDVVRSVETVVP